MSSHQSSYTLQYNNRHDFSQKSLNCLLLLKLLTSFLVSSGSILFFIYFVITVYEKFNINENDFTKCNKGDQVTTLLQYDRNSQIVFGISISAIALSVWVVFHLCLINLYFTDCNCCSNNDNQSQQSQYHEKYYDKNNKQSQFQSFQIQLKQQLALNISRPKSQIPFKLPSEKLRQSRQAQLRNNKINKNKYTKSYNYINNLKPPKIIQRIIKQQQKADCDSFSQCLAYTFCFYCCRTCCSAHKYLFYRSKGQQIFYWFIYLIKTTSIGIFLGYIIANYVSMNNLNQCFSNNIKQYFYHINVLMIIAIITFSIDMLGYFALFIEGTLCENGIYKQFYYMNYDKNQQQAESIHKNKRLSYNNKYTQNKFNDKNQTSQNKLIKQIKTKRQINQNNQHQTSRQTDANFMKFKPNKQSQYPTLNPYKQSKNNFEYTGKYQPQWTKQQQRRPEISVDSKLIKQSNQQISKFSNRYDNSSRTKFGAYNK